MSLTSQKSALGQPPSLNPWELRRGGVAGPVSADMPSPTTEGKERWCGVISPDSPELRLWGALGLSLQLRQLTKSESGTKRSSPCPAQSWKRQARRKDYPPARPVTRWDLVLAYTAPAGLLGPRQLSTVSTVSSPHGEPAQSHSLCLSI